LISIINVDTTQSTQSSCYSQSNVSDSNEPYERKGAVTSINEAIWSPSKHRYPQLDPNNPVFNNEYEIIRKLGSGSTANVFLGRSLKQPSKKVAIKVIKQMWIKTAKNAYSMIEKELEMAQSLDHKNIVETHGFGNHGFITKNGKTTHSDMTYLIMENVSGGCLYDLCESNGAMGEDAGRFIMSQMLDVLEHMHS